MIRNLKNKNIRYKSREILKFYSSNRQTWDEFYPSERWVFEKIAEEKKMMGDILDVGCACGGLGRALTEKSTVVSYTGVDLNQEAIEWALKKQNLSIPSNFIVGDIIELKLNNKYDLVVSLSCADWNIETKKIIDVCWEKVKEGGYFVISLRLTTKKGINDIKRSYQYINFYGDEKEPEIANYAVFNFKEAITIMKNLIPVPELIGAYGYWGEPSETAVTPYSKLVFGVFYIRKGIRGSEKNIKVEFNLPLEVFMLNER